jgi:hypothetical protein
MKRWMQRNIVALVVAGALSVGLAGPAAAQVQIGDGLVNVQIGDITILEDVRVGVAAQIAAEICGVKVGPVVLLATDVDVNGDRETICKTAQGPVRIVQN